MKKISKKVWSYIDVPVGFQQITSLTAWMNIVTRQKKCINCTNGWMNEMIYEVAQSTWGKQGDKDDFKPTKNYLVRYSTSLFWSIQKLNRGLLQSDRVEYLAYASECRQVLLFICCLRKILVKCTWNNRRKTY